MARRLHSAETHYLFLGLLCAGAAHGAEGGGASAGEIWKRISPFFSPPKDYEGDLGGHRSPLLFDDGTKVKTAADWRRRRREILAYWHGVMGPWPEEMERPGIEPLETKRRESFTQKRLRIEIAPGRRHEGYLLLPDGEGPFPAVLTMYYEPETSAGLSPKGKLRDFGYQLVRRGFVTLQIGWPAHYPDDKAPRLQRLSFAACAAHNCCNALAAMPEVDGRRIGVTGHSLGGKMSMFASCLCEKFACGAWSDGGVVWDESRPNVNFWEPWYLGWEKGFEREKGVPSDENPRTGAYRRLVAEGHDLHELHALMAPRPFLVSGGSEDPPERWKALNHAVEVNRLLGYENRVAMTNRPAHSPTEESNEQMYLFFEYFLKHGKALAE